MKNRLLLFASLLILGIVGVSTWFYFLGPCGVNVVDKSISEIAQLRDEWLATADVAVSTSRIALSGPVSSLQSIKREIERIEVPVCLADAQEDMGTAMDSAIDGFLAFMQESPDTETNRLLNTYSHYWDRANRKIQVVQECAPFCN